MAFAAVIPIAKAATAITTPTFTGSVARDMGRFLPGSMPRQEVSALRAEPPPPAAQPLTCRMAGDRRLRRGDEPRVQQGLDLPLSAVHIRPGAAVNEEVSGDESQHRKHQVFWSEFPLVALEVVNRARLF